MRMLEFHIDGFGRFQDLSISHLKPGLSVVVGSNEAGKSTLLAFVRSVLFGFPTRKQAEFYPALNGGRHGGRIVLIDSQSERITVERFAGKGNGQFSATFATGTRISEEQFRQRIGAVTGDVYQNVFAFGLGELQDFKNLQGDSIRDAIYGAGIGSGRRSPREAIETLEKQQKKLFVPGGSNPVMNSLLKAIEQRRQLIQAHYSDPQEYCRLQSELDAADAAIGGIEQQLRDCRHRQARLETLKRAWEDWTTLNESRARLQNLPPRESFPQDGVRRLETLLSEQQTFQGQLSELQDDHQKAQAELSTISVEEAFLSLTIEIKNLVRRVQLFEQQRHDLANVQTEHKLAAQQLLQNLQDLGDEWTEELLASFDLSIPAREEFDTARLACVEATKRVARQSENVARLGEQLQERQEQERAENAKLELLAAPAAKLDIDGIRRLQRHLASYEGAAQDLPGVKYECRGNEERLHDTLRGINPDWTEDRLNQFDNSLAAREELSTHQKMLNRLHSEFEKRQHQAKATQQAIEEHQAVVARDEAELIPLTRNSKADASSLRKHQERLQALRSDLMEHVELQADLARQTERQQDLAAQLSRLEHDIDGTASGLPRWLVPVIALLGVLGLLVIGIADGNWVMGIVVLVMFLIVAAILLLIQRKPPATAQERHTRRLQDLQTVTQRLAGVEQRIRELNDSESELKSRIVKQLDAAQAKVPFSGNTNETHTIIKQIDEQERKVDHELSLLQQRRPIEGRLEENRSKLRRAQSAMQEATNAQNVLQEELKQAQTDWRAWLSSAGLPETLTPELVVVDVLSRLDSARELLKSIDKDRERVRAMQEEINGYQESVRLVAMSSNLDNIPQDPLAAVQFLLDQLKEHEDRARSIEIARQRLAEAANQTVQAQKLNDEARQRHDAEVAGQSNARQQWIALLQRHGLRETLAVDHAEKMWQGIASARAQLAQVDGLRTKEHALSELIAEFVGEVSTVAKKSGLASPTVDGAAACIETLAARLLRAEEARRCFDALREQIEQSTPRIKRLETQIGDQQLKITGLLIAAETEDEETFRKYSAEYEESQSLIKGVRSLETRLRQLCGSDDAALSRLEIELEHSTPAALQTEQLELTERIGQLEADSGERMEYRGKLKLQLQQLEKSEEISQLRMQEESDLATFREHAREWAILRIAAHLVDRAREKYERERRPAVLKRAEQYLARLTRGSYGEILAPAGSDPGVVAPDRSQKELRQLSRGTAEQLYLSLRFGFVEEFVARAEPLPLIFDDILVNFDPDRAQAAAEAIVDLSRSHQILLFTCHPTTVQRLQEICRATAVFELKDGKLKDGSQHFDQTKVVGSTDGTPAQGSP